MRVAAVVAQGTWLVALRYHARSRSGTHASTWPVSLRSCLNAATRGAIPAADLRLDHPRSRLLRAPRQRPPRRSVGRSPNDGLLQAGCWLAHRLSAPDSTELMRLSLGRKSRPKYEGLRIHAASLAETMHIDRSVFSPSSRSSTACPAC